MKKLRKDGVIQIPDKELEATRLHEGDEVCLLYLLGKTLFYGNEEIPPDSRRGVELLEQSMRQQNSMAAYTLY